MPQITQIFTDLCAYNCVKIVQALQVNVNRFNYHLSSGKKRSLSENFFNLYPLTPISVNPDDDTPRAINLDHSAVIMRTDGIVFVQCVDVYYGRKECEEITIAIGEVSGGQRVPVIIAGSDYSSLDKEGRDYSASPEGSRFSLAEAYIIKSMAQKILANFYLKVNKPVVPSRFFREEKEAVEWLYEIREEKKNKKN